MCNGVSLYIANSKKTAELVSELFDIGNEEDDSQTNKENTNTIKK